MVRKGVALVLIGLVLFFMSLWILSIWDIIEIERVLSKSLMTLLVIFIGSGVMMFIFSLIYKSDEDNKRPGRQTNRPPDGADV